MKILFCGYSDYQIWHDLRNALEKKAYEFELKDDAYECVDAAKKSNFDIVFIRFCNIPIMGVSGWDKMSIENGDSIKSVWTFLRRMDSACSETGALMCVSPIYKADGYAEEYWYDFPSVRDVIRGSDSYYEIFRSIDRLRFNVMENDRVR